MADERYMRPGLEFAVAKLAEECGELIAAIGKTMRWGFRSTNPEAVPPRETNEDWILREVSDVETAIIRLRKEFSITTPKQREGMFGYGNLDNG